MNARCPVDHCLVVTNLIVEKTLGYDFSKELNLTLGEIMSATIQIREFPRRTLYILFKSVKLKFEYFLNYLSLEFPFKF